MLVLVAGEGRRSYYSKGEPVPSKFEMTSPFCRHHQHLYERRSSIRHLMSLNRLLVADKQHAIDHVLYSSLRGLAAIAIRASEGSVGHSKPTVACALPLDRLTT
ncbi:hypothetical protein BD309DRAFT_956508 [Dichomitus squalens]|nr:hypothetical protein BD309DRAFT_956508 [Dichomitus squalens]